jgi:excisionase family DNA binding protein
MPEAPPQARRLLRLSEVARILGVSSGRVRELVAEGHLRSVRLGPQGWHRVPADEVERLIRGDDGDAS